MYYPCSKIKGADQLTAKLICTFVFAYAYGKCCVSHDVAHIFMTIISLLLYQEKHLSVLDEMCTLYW